MLRWLKLTVFGHYDLFPESVILKNGEFLIVVVVMRQAVLYKERNAFRYTLNSVTLRIAMIIFPTFYGRHDGSIRP